MLFPFHFNHLFNMFYKAHRKVSGGEFARTEELGENRYLEETQRADLDSEGKGGRCGVWGVGVCVCMCWRTGGADTITQICSLMEFGNELVSSTGDRPGNEQKYLGDTFYKALRLCLSWSKSAGDIWTIMVKCDPISARRIMLGLLKVGKLGKIPSWRNCRSDTCN